MTSKTLRQQRQLAVQGRRPSRNLMAGVFPTPRKWILSLVIIVGLLTQLGVPAFVMVHTVIDGKYSGQMELTIEPTGSLHLKMDNRQGSLTPLESQKSEEIETKTS